MISTSLLLLVGATATGKSTAALELARRNPGRTAILAMDAMQVYRGADVGTGKPTLEEQAEVPHGGLDLVNFGGMFDVGKYLARAGGFLREQAEAGRRVIVVGGTGLYYRALTQGLCEAPQGPEALRTELAGLSTQELRERLRAVDAPMLKQVDGANPRRLTRAIEVMETTGRSLRDWQEATPAPLIRNFRAVWIQRDKEELTARIEARVEEMFAQGWIDEVRGLITKHGNEAVQNFAAIGYREIASALVAGEQGNAGLSANLELLKRDICVATRQYAKRQLTWFAREPNLNAVMLSGAQPLSAVMSDLL